MYFGWVLSGNLVFWFIFYEFAKAGWKFLRSNQGDYGLGLGLRAEVGWFGNELLCFYLLTYYGCFWSFCTILIIQVHLAVGGCL